MARLQYNIFYRRLREFLDKVDFFLEARSSEDSLERLRSQIRSSSSP